MNLFVGDEKNSGQDKCVGPASRAFWRVALDAIDCGVAILSQSGEVLATNSEWKVQSAQCGEALHDHALWLAGLSFESIATQIIEGERKLFEREFFWQQGECNVWYEVRLSRLENEALPEELESARLIMLCRDITPRIEAIASRERAANERAQKQEFLAQAGELLAGSLDFERTLMQVAQSAVPYLADWCFVDLLEGQFYRRVAIAHSDPSETELAHSMKRVFPLLPDAENGVSKVINSGEAQFYPYLDEDLLRPMTHDEQHRRAVAALDVRSSIIVPLRTRGRTLGTLALVASKKLGRAYTRDDLQLAQDLARLAALSVDNARLFSQSEAANRARDDFLAVLSHELRTPLTSILGWVYLLRQPMHDRETHERALQTIEDNTRAQERLVENLIDVSRMVAGKLNIEYQPLELAPLLERAVEKMRPLCREKALRLSLHVPTEPLRVLGDQIRLFQGMENLLSNAYKFTPGGGNIAVRLHCDEEMAHIEVQDTGQGIEPEFLPQLFGIFRQADSTAVRPIGGLGLGLTIVRYIAELHHGNVEAYSEGHGSGTTFRFSLPLLKSTSASKAD